MVFDTSLMRVAFTILAGFAAKFKHHLHGLFEVHLFNCAVE